MTVNSDISKKKTHFQKIGQKNKHCRDKSWTNYLISNFLFLADTRGKIFAIWLTRSESFFFASALSLFFLCRLNLSDLCKNTKKLADKNVYQSRCLVDSDGKNFGPTLEYFWFIMPKSGLLRNPWSGEKDIGFWACEQLCVRAICEYVGSSRGWLTLFGGLVFSWKRNDNNTWERELEYITMIEQAGVGLIKSCTFYICTIAQKEYREPFLAVVCVSDCQNCQ